MPSLSVAEIAALLGSQPEGDSGRLISGASRLSEAGRWDLSFASGEPSLPKSQSAAGKSQAGCLIAPLAFQRNGNWSMIRVSDPRAAFARTLAVLYPERQFKPGIHPTAVIADSARLAPGVHIGPHVSIGDKTVVESGCVIREGCTLGDEVRLGQNSHLYAGVRLCDRVRIGANVIIHSNAVIGADGFGFTLVDGHYRKFPQVGTVEIADDVEIGAGCCIDRAALGVTRIGRGTKLDNLVHIAHNCTVGEHVVIAAQTGLSGSVTIGDYAAIGGQTGIGEKARIEAKAVIGGKAGILTSAVVPAGEPMWGIPARPLRQHLKGLAHVNKLPDLKERIRQLGQQIDELERRLREVEAD